MFRFVLLAALSLAVCAAPVVVEPQPATKLWGCWTVSKALPTTNICALSQEEVDQAIGTRIFYSDKLVKSGKTIVNTPTFSVRQLSDREFFEQFSFIPLAQIGIDARSVIVVEVDGDHGPRSLIGIGPVFLKPTAPVIEYEGVYFELLRAKPEECR